MTAGELRAVLHRKIHRRLPLRWSTLLMAVAFVGLGALYLEVRTPPVARVYVATTPVPTTTVTRTTPPPSTTTTTTVGATDVHRTVQLDDGGEHHLDGIGHVDHRRR